MIEIKQSAIITNIDKSFLTLELEQKSACAGCHHQKTCSSADCQKKELRVALNKDKVYHKGQMVFVTINEAQGWIAIFYGYILPLALLLSTMLTCSFFTQNEFKIAFFSIFILIPYYFLLFLCKKHIATKFSFKIDDN